MVFDPYYIVQEGTFIGSSLSSPFKVKDGEGDFAATSSWVATVPAENEWYQMTLKYVLQQEPRRTISIVVAVANTGTVFANWWGIPSGLGIEFRRAGRIPFEDFIWQHVPIAEGDITGDILLRLNFDDTADQFTAEFSLDGGATFQSPFVPIGWGREEPELGEDEWGFSGQSILEIRAIPAIPAVGWLVLALLLPLTALWMLRGVGQRLGSVRYGGSMRPRAGPNPARRSHLF
jgi:hypothetical protein